METDGYTLEVRVEQGVMLARVAEVFPDVLLEKKENLFQPVVEACEGNLCQKIVIDARGLQVDFNTMAIFRAGVDAAIVSKLGFCLAIVAREDMIDSFFQDVVTNRGARVGVFTDLDDAMAWVSGS